MNTRANTETQIRALVWEEARVGGSIAGVCALVGISILAATWFRLGDGDWRAAESLIQFAAYGVPALAGLLLVLTPDNSGHLVGGFSRRVLRLPVSTPVAVAVILLARTAFVSVVATMLVGAASLFWTNSTGLKAAGLIILLYLAVQLIDWVRGVISGLTTLILAYLLMLGAAVFLSPILDFRFLFLPVIWFVRLGLMAAGSQRAIALAIPLGAIAFFAVSWFSVLAQRVGRRYGLPDFWEWPRRIQFARSSKFAPFRAPLGAQVWFELRRSKWVLPIATAIGLIASAALSPVEGWTLMKPTLLLPPCAFLLGTALHGLLTRVTGVRRISRTSGYEYLQPLTDAQFASARVMASAIQFFPALFAFTIAHYWVGLQPVFLDALSHAMREGMSSPRELIWIVLGRPLLLGLIAWPLLMIGTRLFRRGLLMLIAVGAAALYTVARPLRDTLFAHGGASQVDAAAFVVSCFLIAGVIAALIYAWHKAAAPRSALLFWVVVWFLGAWLVQYPIVSAWLGEPIPLTHRIAGYVVAFSLTAPIPLVYVGILFDVRRRRSQARATLDPAQYERAIRLNAPKTAAMLVAAAFVIWLGWPSQPAYVEYRRVRGYPATLKDLDDWYQAPPAGQNPAMDYLAAVDEIGKLKAAYDKEFVAIRTRFTPPRIRGIRQASFDSNAKSSFGYVYIAGEAEFPEGQKLDPRAWNATEFYWNRVTSKIAPRLQEIGAQDTSLARYPIDLNRGPGVKLEHLASIREAARQSMLDALHWTVARKPDKAVDSIEAGFAISKSLSNEPLLISQLVRIATLELQRQAIESLLNRSVPQEADLARLQRAVERAMPDTGEGLMLDRAFIGEGSMATQTVMVNGTFSGRRPVPTIELATSTLLFSAPAANVGFLTVMDATMNTARVDYPTFSKANAGREEEFYTAISFFSPLVAILMPSLSRAYEGEWRARIYLETARTAIAVERYRLANNKLPAALQDLVPQFLSAVPGDYFAGAGQLLRYRIFEDGSYVVYSLARNMTDEGGLAGKKGNDWMNGDLRFTVASMALRTGPQIAPN